MKTTPWFILLPFLAGIGVGAAITPAHAEGSWVLNHCTQALSDPTSWTRENARAYAGTANGDGYDWGGGCWNEDGTDNTPAQSDSHNSVGEGADCSGLTFKAWAMNYDYSASRRRWSIFSNALPYAHGPYTAADFKAGTGAVNPLPDKSYATTHLMDAFASTTHIGMIYQAGTSGGMDTIVEAKDQGTKMGIFTRNYRGDPAYSGVKRSTWD